MKNFVIKNVIALALTSIPTFASAGYSFLTEQTLNVGGGVVTADLYTSEKIVAGTTQYTIDALSGKFVESGVGGSTYTSLTLLGTGQQFPSSATTGGNTPTDNLFLTAGGAGGFLTSGGYAFGYSSDPADKYQVYFADNKYQGCWSQSSDCITIIGPIFLGTIGGTSPGGFPVPTIPEPEQWVMMLIGVSVVGYQVKRQKPKQVLVS